MASSAEQLAANFNLSGFGKASDLKKRIMFTLGALIIFRIGTYIPVPGVDPSVLAALLSHNGGGILGMFNMFSGGALGRTTIFALNILPYISASIIIQLMTAAVPSLSALQKEGASGQAKLTQYTRYLTVFIAIFQSYGFALGIESVKSPLGVAAVTHPGMFFLFSTVITLVGGTIFLMWLGEQITSRGVGNGASLIIMIGIIANLPASFIDILELGNTGALSTGFVLFFLLFSLAVIAFVVFMESAYRRVIIQYPKHRVGDRMTGGDTTHMPLKVNTSGVIPPIFASSLLLIPATVVGFSGHSDPYWLQEIAAALSGNSPYFLGLYGALIFFFTFFYTAVVFNVDDTADNLKKNGGFIPGIRPGKQTAVYFDKVMTRITVLGAVYLVIVCLAPQYFIGKYSLPFYFGGTSLLIIVSVILDTMTQIQSHLLAHQYEGLLRKSRARAGRASGGKRIK